MSLSSYPSVQRQYNFEVSVICASCREPIVYVEPEPVVTQAIERLFLSPQPQLEVNTIAEDSFSLYLGEPSNDYGHEVDIEVDTGLANFIQFDRDTKTISIPVKSTTESNVGSYTIRITLSSSSLDSQEEVDIKLNVFPAPEKAEIEIDQEDEK